MVLYFPPSHCDLTKPFMALCFDPGPLPQKVHLCTMKSPSDSHVCSALDVSNAILTATPHAVPAAAPFQYGLTFFPVLL